MFKSCDVTICLLYGRKKQLQIMNEAEEKLIAAEDRLMVNGSKTENFYVTDKRKQSSVEDDEDIIDKTDYNLYGTT